LRESLLNSFDEIYIINLHGNTLKKESDKNLFDIMVGVNISIFVKHKTPLKNKKLYYYSTLENNLISREEKLNFLENNSLDSIDFKELEVKEPNYFFTYKDNENIEEYNEFWSVTDIFNIYSVGIETQKDNISIQYTKENLENLKDEFLSKNENDLREKFNIIDGTYWKLQKAIKSFDNYNPQKIIYRPFDTRYTNYYKGFLGRDRFEVMQHLISNINLSLIVPRQADVDKYKHIFISNLISEGNLIGTAKKYGSGSVFPLYTYHETMGETQKEPNFTKQFKEFLETLSFKPTPEEILSYIYARLHSQKYRDKYFEFLKIDFPKVPFTKDEKLFFKYANLGQKLIDLHLLKDELEDETIKFTGLSKNRFIEKITLKDEVLSLNDDIKISGVTKDIFDFEIGSYKVIDKWLKYRKKDNVKLTGDDFLHLNQMIIAIKQTIKIMRDIDKIEIQ
jgi:predicted helicase